MTPFPRLDRATEAEADLIRAALTRQAERTPRPDAVLAALSPGARPAVGRRVLPRRTAGIAAVLASAAGVAVAAGGVDGAPAPPAVSAGTAGARTSRLTVPLQYSPSWLPAGLFELERRVITGPGGVQLDRTWVREAPPFPLTGNAFLMSTVRSRADIAHTQGVAVTVGGRLGRYVAPARSGDKARLEWEPREGTWLTLVTVGLGLDQATMVRIATSMRPDRGSVRSPLGLAASMERNVDTYDTRIVDRRDWRTEVLLRSGVTIRLVDPDEAPAGGEPVQVSGRTGHHSAANGGPPWLGVPFGSGKVLLLTADHVGASGVVGPDPATLTPRPSPTDTGDGAIVPVAELVDIARAMDLSVEPDTSWGR